MLTKRHHSETENKMHITIQKKSYKKTTEANKISRNVCWFFFTDSVSLYIRAIPLQNTMNLTSFYHVIVVLENNHFIVIVTAGDTLDSSKVKSTHPPRNKNYRQPKRESAMATHPYASIITPLHSSAAYMPIPVDCHCLSVQAKCTLAATVRRACGRSRQTTEYRVNVITHSHAIAAACLIHFQDT